MTTELLAKQPIPGRKPVTLGEHTRDVIVAARELFGTESPSRLGSCWLSFFGLPDLSWPEFRNHLWAACVLHDWGKASDSFQNAIIRKLPQVIRHEHLSALMIARSEVSRPLTAAGFDVPLLLSAVLTHHLKAGSKKSDLGRRMAGGVNSLELLIGSEFRGVLDATVEAGLPKMTLEALPRRWRFGGNPNCVDDQADNLTRLLWRLSNELRRDEPRSQLLLAVRTALIAADAAGSGLVRQGHGIADWIRRNVSNGELLTRDRIFRDIITPRIKELTLGDKPRWIDQGDGKDGWTDFQLACDSLPPRALLIAPCGSGKTLAAWRWISAQLADRPARHVLFLYPTRATAREGFKDYVSWAPEADARLMHGTSGFDLEGMFENPPDGDDRDRRNYEVERRLFALGYWSGRAFSATVDQFLAYMQHGYAALCMLPVLVDSVVVIDEVHSFDRNMFAALKDFLQSFRVPVLCMTATLPNDRRQQLVEECGLSPPPAWSEDLQVIADFPRYRVRRVNDRIAAVECVREALAEGKRVLWVVNQVRRAHELVREFVTEFDPQSDSTELQTECGVPVICYHSRFRLRDRVNRHADTMRWLKKPLSGAERAALGITTQVCEMSLDIDVDLLVTEAAPVTSLVQRFGRCNRERQARSLDVSGAVVVYTPDAEAPYSPNDLRGVPEFLSRIDGKDLSQSDLEAIMTSLKEQPEREGDPDSQFLASGAFAVGPRDDGGESFREGNDFNSQCVLLEDVPSYVAGNATTRAGLILPVPKKLAKSRDPDDPLHARLPRFLSVAAGGHYHAAIGYLDQQFANW